MSAKYRKVPLRCKHLVFRMIGSVGRPVCQLRWFGLMFLLGMVGWVDAATYRDPALGSPLIGPRDLRLENTRIVQEQVLADGRTLMEVSTELRNLDDGTWVDLSVNTYSAIQKGKVEAVPSTILGTNLVLRTQDSVILPGLSHVVVDAADRDIALSTLAGTNAMTATGLAADGALITENGQLRLEDFRLVSETPMSGGKLLIRFGYSVRNLATNEIRELTLTPNSNPGPIHFGYADYSIQFGAQLNPLSVASGTNTLIFLVSGAPESEIRNGIEQNTFLDVYGTELWEFEMPVKAVDRETGDLWLLMDVATLPSDRTLVFSSMTTLLSELRVGDLLVAGPASGLPLFSEPDPNDPFQLEPPILVDSLPLRVDSVTTVGGRVHVKGLRMELLSVLKRATMIQSSGQLYPGQARELYDPAWENTYDAAEKLQRQLAAQVLERDNPQDVRLPSLRGMSVIPWHFNEVMLSDKVKLGGELLFRSSGFKMEVGIRDFEMQRVILRMDAGAELNMVVEVTDHEDTGPFGNGNPGVSIIRDLGLPVVTFSIAGVPVTLEPFLGLEAGVEAQVPGPLILPLQSSFRVGINMGWEKNRVTATEDGFFYEPFHEFVPVRISDPGVTSELESRLSVWAQLNLGVKGSVAATLSAGPSLGVRIQNNFEVAPLGNPWWSMDSDVDLNARLELKILGRNVADTQANLFHFDLFHRDAGRGLGGSSRVAPSEVSGASTGSGLQPLAGETVRWSRLVQSTSVLNEFRSAFVCKSGDGTGMVAGGAPISNSAMSKYTDAGELLWTLNSLTTQFFEKAASLADGSIITAGHVFSDVVVARFDKDGQQVWVNSHRITPALNLTAMVVVTNDAGLSAIYLTGYADPVSVRGSQPVLVKLDEQGRMVWLKTYLSDGDNELHGMHVAANGDLLLCGFTSIDVAPPAVGAPDWMNPIKNLAINGLVMRVRPADGSLIWATACVNQWGMSFEDVTEGPDGSIYTGGAAGKIVTQNRPVSLFGKFRSSGELLSHVVVGDDPEWTDETPDSGRTPYDSVRSLIWTPEGLMACGSTGLGSGTAGWLMGLTEELGVKFYTVVDGKLSDSFLALADMGDGVAVLGNTSSVHPWGKGGAAVGFLSKFPWEGIMRFNPETSIQTKFLQPWIHKSSDLEEFAVFSNVVRPTSVERYSSNSGSVTFSNGTLTVTAGQIPAVPKFTSGSAVTPVQTGLEATDPSLIRDFAGFAAYYHLEGTNAVCTADIDGDGLSNGLEAALGRNPLIQEAGPLLTVTSGSSAMNGEYWIEYARARGTALPVVQLESAASVTGPWALMVGNVAEVISKNAQSEVIRVRVPVLPGARAQWVRVRGAVCP